MAGVPPDTADQVTLESLVRDILARARRHWRAAVLVRATLRAAAIAVALVVTLVAIDAALPLPTGIRAALRLAPVVALLAVVGRALARAVVSPADTQLALFAEEHVPSLRGWLTTSLAAPSVGRIAAVFRQRATTALSAARAARFGPLVPRRLMRTVGAAVAAAVLVLLVLPGGTGELWQRWVLLATEPAGTSAPAGARAERTGSALFDDVAITVEPPAYTGEQPYDLDSTRPVLAGSIVTVRGSRSPTDTRLEAAVLNGPALQLQQDAGGWSVSWRTSPDERGLSLVARDRERIVARRVVPISVLQDREPAVTLHLPEEDIVLAAPRGVLPLRATAVDDHGVADFRISWILSRGSGESFSFTEGEWRWRDTERRTDGITGEYDLDIAAAGLEPGDVLHVRAVARDGNDVTGPGTGVSVTRLIRIARADEMAEVTTLIGFPLEPEREPVLSQRMIILLTERLIERSAGMSRDARLRESTRIADEQARLRAQLTDIIYSSVSEEDHEVGPIAGVVMPSRVDADTMAVGEWTRRMAAVLEAASRATGTGRLEERTHEHDADPSIAVNRELLPAFDAMYAAERVLRLGEPARALTEEYRALEIIQRAREAERVFLRGEQSVAPVDVAAARGTGEIDDARPADRSPAPAQDDVNAPFAGITAVAARLASLEARDAALVLTELAARVLENPTNDARAGALLARAADAARTGNVAIARSLALQARALLAPDHTVAGSVTAPVAASGTAAAYFERLREAVR